MEIAHIHLPIVDHLIGMAQLESGEFLGQVAKDNGRLLLHQLADLTHGSLHDLGMIEWQRRKLVDRTPLHGGIPLTAMRPLAKCQLSDCDQTADAHL